MGAPTGVRSRSRGPGPDVHSGRREARRHRAYLPTLGHFQRTKVPETAPKREPQPHLPHPRDMPFQQERREEDDWD